MKILTAAILGVVQGLTEFLPVSSSAHLMLMPWLFGWTPEGLAFDVSLHLGTAIAILAFFWSDWAALIKEAVCGLSKGKPLGNQPRRLAWYLIAGSAPAAVAGYMLEDLVENRLRSPLVTAAALAVFGLVLYVAEIHFRQTRTIKDLRWADAVFIGCCQAIALIPGVSRSGITISGGLICNMDRISATRFSFLLATPIVVGAGMLKILQLAVTEGAAVRWDVFAVGMSCAAFTGLLCIKYFLRYVGGHTFKPFVAYRFLLAGLVLMYYFKYML